MKVLHIIVGLNVGGAELMLERLIHLDADSDRQHKVISISGIGTVGKRMQAAGVLVDALDANRPSQIPGAVLQMRRIIQNYGPDVVQTWMYHADLIGGLAARLAGNQTIVWNVRTNANPRSAFPVKTRLLQRLCALMGHLIPKRIIAASEAGLDSHAAIGYPRGRMLAIGNGFAIPAQKDLDAARPRIRKEWNLASDACAIGMVGRFYAPKGHENFVRAAGMIAESLPRARFVIIGRDCDMGNQVLASWIAEAGLQDRILLLGERSDIPDCLAALDVFCLPSLIEGFPNALGEAMAAGKACVTTSAGAAAELLAGHGILVPVGDSGALAQGIADLASMPLPEREAMGHAARQHIATTRGMTQVLTRYIQLYTSLTGGTAVPSRSIDGQV